MIRAVLFDLDDTLVPESTAWQAAFDAAWRRAAYADEINPADVREAVFDAAATLWEASPVIGYCRSVGIGCPSSLLSDFPGDGQELRYLREWASTYRQQAWSAGLAAVGISDERLGAALAAAFKTSFAAIHEPFPDVVPALDKLAGLRLGVLTNGASDLQRNKLAVSRLSPRFEVVLISSEVGSGKPSPLMFELALAQMGVEARECLMVGDSLPRDIEPASAMGMPTVLLSRSRSSVDHDGAVIQTLQGLSRMIRV